MALLRSIFMEPTDMQARARDVPTLLLVSARATRHRRLKMAWTPAAVIRPMFCSTDFRCNALPRYKGRPASIWGKIKSATQIRTLPAAEVELLRCDYAARCSLAGCRQYRATTIVRYVDHQGPPIRQLEVCD